MPLTFADLDLHADSQRDLTQEFTILQWCMTCPGRHMTLRLVSNEVLSAAFACKSTFLRNQDIEYDWKKENFNIDTFQ
jgi:hypothetical protein